MAHITSYDDFQASLQPGVTAATAAAPWSISTNINGSVTPNFLNKCYSGIYSGEFDFACRGIGAGFNFQWNFTVNISFDMSQYGGATGLDFTWGYQPDPYIPDFPNGSSFFTDSQVGSRHFHEQGVVGTITYGTYDWNPDNKVSQSGYTSVLVSPGERIGYIPITLVSPVVHAEGTGMVGFDLKQLNFTVVYPPPDPTSPVSTPPDSTSTVSTTSTVATPPVATGIIVGTAIGGIVVLILLLFTATYLYRSKRRHRLDLLEKDTVAVEADGASPPLEKDGSVPEAGVASALPPSWRGMNVPANVLAVENSDEPSSQVDSHVDHTNSPGPARPPPKASASSHAVIQATVADTGALMRGERAHSAPQAALDTYTDRSTIEPPPHFSTIPDDLTSATQNPPIYGSSTGISAWANSNRTLISEDLEAKLLAAGYMPSDDPDILTEDEWRTNHGVMKLELVRLRRIYARWVLQRFLVSLFDWPR